jgi:hypothetical protein
MTYDIRAGLGAFKTPKPSKFLCPYRGSLGSFETPRRRSSANLGPYRLPDSFAYRHRYSLLEWALLWKNGTYRRCYVEHGCSSLLHIPVILFQEFYSSRNMYYYDYYYSYGLFDRKWLGTNVLRMLLCIPPAASSALLPLLNNLVRSVPSLLKYRIENIQNC